MDTVTVLVLYTAPTGHQAVVGKRNFTEGADLPRGRFLNTGKILNLNTWGNGNVSGSQSKTSRFTPGHSIRQAGHYITDVLRVALDF